MTLDAGWWWAIAGVALLAAELIAPGFFLFFLGVAALAVGGFTLAFDLGPSAQVGLFVLYALVALLAGRRFYARAATDHHDPDLDDPTRRLIGRQLVAATAIGDGGGRVRVGDSEWSARGGPAAPGEAVIVRRVEGNCLIVDPLPALPKE